MKRDNFILRQIIKEELSRIVENETMDGDVDAQIEEYMSLTQEIQMLEAKLRAAKSRRSFLGGLLSPFFSGVSDVKKHLHKTQKFIVEVARKGGTRSSYKYADLFELALTKVNSRTRALLERVREETASMHELEQTYKITPLGESLNESKVLSKLISYAKNAFAKIKRLIFGLHKDLNELEKISKQMLK